MHHFITAEVNGQSVKTINGNSMYQGITIKTNSLKEISYYYTIDDPFYNYLAENYG